MPAKKHQVVIVGIPPAQMLDVTGPLDVFCIANDISRAMGQAGPYEVSLAGVERGALMTTSGISINANASIFDKSVKVDTLLISGGPGARLSIKDQSTVKRLRQLCDRAQRVGSICTGSFPLAATGVLDQCRATTHWAHFDEFAGDFPHIELDRDALFVNSGKYFTSAGITAGIDFSLSLIEQDLGRAMARAVARELVVFMKRPGGQSQFSVRLMHDAVGDDKDRFDALTRWMAEHLNVDMSVELLAARLSMSPRNFSRRFAESMKITPGKYVEALRIDEARRLLTDGELSISRIAKRCGFPSDEAMRLAFQRQLNISPSEFRSRFRSVAGD
jgi:transcriptional regulator GlxA family with amidase domain